MTSAFGSYSGCRQYQEDLDLAVEGLNAEDLSVEKIRLFWNHPGFFEAMVQRLKSSISEIDNDTIQKLIWLSLLTLFRQLGWKRTPTNGNYEISLLNW
ncbi:MAG: hypothetical protein CM15mP49_14940 [Actinomycetota bacterium]|nr:MAG: hypothetical protein CM15mP49_14940 [Actinomycetota bacterium]